MNTMQKLEALRGWMQFHIDSIDDDDYYYRGENETSDKSREQIEGLISFLNELIIVEKLYNKAFQSK